MQKILAALFLTTLLAPAFAAADSFGIQPTLGQLLTRIAALEAILSHSLLNCAVTATKTMVHPGESFTLAWGSFGADPSYSNDAQNVYPINGEQAMQLDSPQTRMYSFSFYGQNGTKKTCDQTITVLPR